MAVLHISEEELAHDLNGILSKARAGEEIVIEDRAGTLRLTRQTQASNDPLLPRYTTRAYCQKFWPTLKITSVRK